MAKTMFTGKRGLISKANSIVVISSGIAAFIFIFCLIASKTLFNQMQYQNRVISKERGALNVLKSDLKSADTLVKSYQAFNETPTNVINGDPNGNGLQDGNNAKIVLDALPTTNDSLALTTSMYKLLSISGVVVNISTDTGGGSTTTSTDTGTANPQPVPIPLSVTATGNYQGMQTVIARLEHSIRPMQVQKLTLSGSEANMSLSATVQLYYQPAKSLTITKTVVK